MSRSVNGWTSDCHEILVVDAQDPQHASSAYVLSEGRTRISQDHAVTNSDPP